jgi:5-methylthioadenosine/S-adenosylhomocysteine deaminase
MRTKLLRGGTVVSLASGQPVSEVSDLLIERDLIAAMGAGLPAADAEVIDVTGQLVMPGFIDAHRHSWQTSIRGVAADWSLLDYVREIRMGYATVYRPEDVYVSILVGALEAIDSGITTMCDFCHIMNSPAHADAALEAFVSSGIRGTLCYGFYDVPLSEPAFHSHADRILDAERFLRRSLTLPSSLMQIGVALTEGGLVTPQQARAEIEFARANGIRITAHMGTLSTPDAVRRLGEAGLLGPDMLHVHCNLSEDDELEMIRDSGGAVVSTPETELQMGMGFPVIGRLLKLGLRPAIGIDIVSENSGDMFTQLRLALQVERALRNETALKQRKMPAKISPSVRDGLDFAVRNGAEALGLSGVTGWLAPGMKADIITIGQDGMNFMPPAPPVESIVLQARASDICNVVIGGNFKKRDGKLVGWDLGELRQRIRNSSVHIHETLKRRGKPRTGTTEAYASAISQIIES